MAVVAVLSAQYCLYINGIFQLSVFSVVVVVVVVVVVPVVLAQYGLYTEGTLQLFLL